MAMAEEIDKEFDMNLDNYGLQDILALFKVSYNFNENDLKQAKKMVLQTHPDKSQLPKEYFIFFTAAFKILLSIYQFRNRSTAKDKVTTYTTNDLVDNDETTLQMVNNLKDKKNFNKVFNELFDKFNIKDEDAAGGYGDWLKSEEDVDARSTTFAEMNNNFEKKKKEISALVPIHDLKELGVGGSGYELTGRRPEYYSSDVFSNNLPYEDLRKAHVESVIPVTQEEYLRRPKYKNVEELQRDRAYNDVKPLSMQKSQELLQKKNQKAEYEDVTRAFTLAKQTEQAAKINNKFLHNFKLM
jgi:hypothetical protein